MLSDKIEWVKVSGASWQGDGFYYSRYPKPEGSALAAKNENHQVFYHKVGTAQAADELVYEDKVNVQRFHGVYVSEDEQFAFLNLSDRGKGKDGNALFYRCLLYTSFSLRLILLLKQNWYLLVQLPAKKRVEQSITTPWYLLRI